MFQTRRFITTALLATIIFPLLVLAANAGQNNSSKEKQNLKNFAYANCLYWHFKSKNYDINDIAAISGGFVEMGSSSADSYQKISLFIKNYKTKRKTKQNIDPSLLKCFYLDQNSELRKLIESIL